MRPLKGLTLLELLLAVTLGLGLALVVERLTTVAYRLQTQMSDEQFLLSHSLLAERLLLKNIHTAGWVGCPRLRAGMSAFITPDNFIQVSTTKNQSVLTIRRMAQADTSLKGADYLVVSNCRQVRVVTPAELAKLSTAGDTVLPLQVISFFIQSSGHPPAWGWYEKTQGDNAVEKVPGVDRFQADIVRTSDGAPIAVHIQLHLTAPHGATREDVMTIALGEQLK
jgi:hypothetical protein